MNSVFVEHSISVIPDLFSFYTKGSQSQREKKLFSHKIIDFLSINIWDIKLVMVPKHSMFLNDNVLWFMMILQLWMCVCVCVCAQSCWTLCDPMDCSCQAPLSMSYLARILVWAAIAFSRRSSQPRDCTHISCIGVGFFRNGITWEARYFSWVSPIT